MGSPWVGISGGVTVRVGILVAIAVGLTSIATIVTTMSVTTVVVTGVGIAVAANCRVVAAGLAADVVEEVAISHAVALLGAPGGMTFSLLVRGEGNFGGE